MAGFSDAVARAMSRRASPVPVGVVLRLRSIESLNAAAGEYRIVRVRPDGRDGEPLLFAKRSHATGARGMDFFADAEHTRLALRYVLRKEPGLRVYTVTDADGLPRCEVRRLGEESRWRSVLRLSTPTLAATITERGSVRPLLRRLSDASLPVNFDVTDTESGASIADIERDLSVRDRRTISVHDPRLREDVAAVLPVLLDSELFL